MDHLEQQRFLRELHGDFSEADAEIRATWRKGILVVLLIGLFWALAALATVGEPYAGAPVQISGTTGASTVIQAENFNKGGEGVGYHQPLAGNCAASADAGTQCGCSQATRLTEDLRICTVGAATYLTNVEAGLWAEYAVQFNAYGEYTVELSVAFADAACCAGAAYHIELDGQRYPNVGSYMLGPALTADWQAFEWRGKSDLIEVLPGVHRLRIVADQHWFNWDAIRVTYAAGTQWMLVPTRKIYKP